MLNNRAPPLARSLTLSSFFSLDLYPNKPFVPDVIGFATNAATRARN